MSDSSVLLRMEDIRKVFGEKVAIQSIDLDVRRGEVHALCGENGAGKSTLVNILCGIHRADGGRVVFDGQPVEFAEPKDASLAGVGMVHQHFTLVPSMTVAENIYLNKQPRRGPVVDRAAMRRAADELIERYGFVLSADDKIADLTVGQRQRVEILKALAFEAKLLVLDEPTAVLTPPEIDELLTIVAQLRERGCSVLFITHKLREVKAVSDRVTVVRRGETVGTRRTADVSEAQIAELMVGRPVFLSERRDPVTIADSVEPALELRSVTALRPTGTAALTDVDLAVRPGEIVGIAGVEGNGQTQLAEVVAGLLPVESGTVHMLGEDVTSWTAGERRAHRFGIIAEDRLDRGVSPTMSIAENLAVSNYQRFGLARRGLVDAGKLSSWSRERIEEYDVRGATPGLSVGSLSGGNMQKIVVARELSRDPKVLMVSQPTRGVDIGASEFVRRQILSAAEAGAAVLLVSSELSEVLALSDRVGVLFRGQLLAVLPAAEATEQRVGLLMNGGTEDVA